MFIKELCQRCRDQNMPEHWCWGAEDDTDWKDKKQVYCTATAHVSPASGGIKGFPKSINIAGEPPTHCGYLLEHLMYNDAQEKRRAQ